MTELSHINLEFLSNENLINVLRSVLEEIDILARYNAHRSTTYLAVSTIEGIFRELIQLLRLTPSTVPTWPTIGKTKTPVKFDKLKLAQMGQILYDEKKLPEGFDDLYDRVREYRNYMHPSVELENLIPIDQSVAQLTLSCLTALLNQYAPLRFIADQQWRLVVGKAHPQANNSIDMQHSGDDFAMLVSELPARNFKQIKFRVNIPRGRIFNFVYNYSSRNRFMATRIDKRIDEHGNAHDNGLLKCSEWHDWDIVDRYVEAGEPNAQLQEHTVQVILSPSSAFEVLVDSVPLALKGGTSWDFNPEYKIGFMSEIGMVTLKDITVQ